MYTRNMVTPTAEKQIAIDVGGDVTLSTENEAVTVHASDAALLLSVGITSAEAPTITTASPLTGGTKDVAYNQSIAATGGDDPYTFTLQSGTLPTGLSLATSGAITGTPTVAETKAFTVRCTGENGGHASKAFSLTIAP